MKAGDLVRLKRSIKTGMDPSFQTARLVDVTDESVKVIIEGIDGYFIFAIDCVHSVIDEVQLLEEALGIGEKDEND